MSTWIHNVSGGSKTYRGVPVADDAYYQIELANLHWYQSSDDVLADLGSGDLRMSADGTTDYSTSAAKNVSYLMGVVPVPVTLHNIPKVAVYEPEGVFSSFPSHDWCNPKSWYSGSTAVTGETLTLDTGNIYDSANTNWICLENGTIMDEDLYWPDYKPVIYDGGTPISEDDYTINYATGVVTLDSAPSGAVTADYNHANSSTFTLAPEAGKVLTLRHAEVQFAKNVQMSAMVFEVWVYNPADLPNKVKYEERLYKNEKDLITIGNEGTGVIPAFGALTQDILVFPFKYSRPILLDSATGAEMRVRIISDSAFTGEWANVTFYCVVEDS